MKRGQDCVYSIASLDLLVRNLSRGRDIRIDVLFLFKGQYCYAPTGHRMKFTFDQC